MPKKTVLKRGVLMPEKNRPISASSWTRDQLEVLIEEMKPRPELYGKTRGNLSETKRSLAEVTKALKPIRPNVNTEDVKSHIRAIRDQYYREVARLEKNKRMGVEDDTPRLWCFSRLTFLSENVGSLQDSDADEGSAGSNSPVSDVKLEEPDEQEEEDEEEEGQGEKWAKEFLERYLEQNENKSSEHKAFLKFVKSQLELITNYNILSKTKLGMLQELESGFRLQKESENNGVANGNTSSQIVNDKYNDGDDEMEDDLI